MTELLNKKSVLHLQKLVIDGLEDVKAQEIKVFNTEGLSPLFERVIIASGTSNRQTKALAASVRDAVREAGYSKPRIEGEENGEWIIVDCGPVVAHIMQPAIRQYYHLEEIWGEKPVRYKHGDEKVSELPKARTPKQKSEQSESKKIRSERSASSSVATQVLKSSATNATQNKKKTKAEAAPSTSVDLHSRAKSKVKSTAAKSTSKSTVKSTSKSTSATRSASKSASKSAFKSASKATAKVSSNPKPRKTSTPRA